MEKTTVWKKVRESTAILISKECRKYEKLISFFIHWLIQILVVVVVGPDYQYNLFILRAQ